MLFEWDETKRQQLIRERGVDVAYAALIFRASTLTATDGRRDYGEERWVSLGMIGNDCFVVVHTMREGASRIITAWKGGRSDRTRYEAFLAGGT